MLGFKTHYGLMVNKQDFFTTYSYFEKDILVEIIDIFNKEAPAKVEKLYADLETLNFENLRFDAHSLKGTIGSFCAPEAWALAKDLETIATHLIEKNGDGFFKNLIFEKIKEIETAVNMMISQLTEIKNEIIVN